MDKTEELTKRITSQATQREKLRGAHAAEVEDRDGKEKGWLGGNAQKDLVSQSSTKAHLHWS